MGLAISRELIEKGYFIEIADREEGDTALLPDRKYRYSFCDLLDFDEDFFSRLASDRDTEILVITAGIGRIADFQAHHTAEIKKIIETDASALIRIIRIFYGRILSDSPFFTAVMGSISGRVCSPAASVYAAAKAAVVRFAESVNIELEDAGTPNRILEVSPGFFSGSRFYGKRNDLNELAPLAREITERMFARETLFIPRYEETYKDVLERCHADPHAFGLQSYRYKKESGRLDNGRKVIIGYLSGTFDLFHVGHLNLLRRARACCDYLIVGIHESGSWKGKETFIPFSERKAIVAACRYVDKVVESLPEDSDAWGIYHFDRLFVGSDYKGSERFRRYEEFFKDKDVEIIYFPYTRETNSTQIRNTILLKTKDPEEGG